MGILQRGGINFRMVCSTTIKVSIMKQFQIEGGGLVQGVTKLKTTFSASISLAHQSSTLISESESY